MCEATWQQPPAEVAEFSASTDPPATLLAAPTIGGIFRQYGAAYLQKYAHRMSHDQLKAMVGEPYAIWPLTSSAWRSAIGGSSSLNRDRTAWAESPSRTAEAAAAAIAR